MQIEYNYGIECQSCGAYKFITTDRALSKEEIDSIEKQPGFCSLCRTVKKMKEAQEARKE